eukprot:scaffold171152_cov15-Tisochrysis_lutea.AAC.1
MQCKVGTVLPCSKSKPTVNKSKPSCAVCGNRAGALRAILLGCGTLITLLDCNGPNRLPQCAATEREP